MRALRHRGLSLSLVTMLFIGLCFSLSSGILLQSSSAITATHAATHSRTHTDHGAMKHEMAEPAEAPAIRTAQPGTLPVNITQVGGQMDQSMPVSHSMSGRTTLTNLDSLLKTSPYFSNAFASSAARLSGTAVNPASINASRPAQIIDVAVGPGASLSYSPDQITINVGDTVRWTFIDVGHNVVSGSACVANNVFCSPDDVNCSVTGSSSAGAVYTHVFNQAGTFDYFCSPHCFNAMTGRVTVNAVTIPHAVKADYDGDGKVDVAVFRPSQGTFYILLSSNGGFRAVQFGTSGDLPVPGDFDNDGKADVAVFRPSAGAWYRLNSSNGAFVGQNWGASTDKPVVGDFDGDGKTDLAVFRPAEGSWYILQSGNGGFRGQQFGASTDTPVAADYDGDSKTDLAVYRDGAWYITQSSNNLFRSHQFGIATDRPSAGDYDGDSKADIAVFRPAEGTFYILLSSNGGFRGQQWGTNGDLPAPAAFVP